MDSRLTPRSAGFDQSGINPHVLTIPPPPPLSAGHRPLSHRRRHVIQPPALTTTLTNFSTTGVGLGFGPARSSTPPSTSSVSNPFSQRNAPSSSGPVNLSGRGTSPMALRVLSGQSVPYNPQEWIAPSGSSPQLNGGHIQTTRLSRSEDSIANPPPPYSPRPAPVSRTNTNSTTDPSSAGTIPSQFTSPTSAATTVSPGLLLGSRSSAPRPLSMINTSEGFSVPQAGRFPPPPPSTSNTRSRPSSQNPADRLQRAFNLSSFTGRHKQASELPHANALIKVQKNTADTPSKSAQGKVALAPAAKRALSADALSTPSSSSNMTSRDGSQSPSRKDTWEPGMPLPGPPPGPPPTASRSQSASGLDALSSRHLLNPAPRPKIRQPPHLGTSLGPVPPTPADWAEDSWTPAPQRFPTSLHIDTTNLSVREGKLPDRGADPGSPGSQLRIYSFSTPGLFRSAARRESSANGIRERRRASKGAQADAAAELSAISMSSNPWADALAVKPRDLDLGHSAMALRNLSGTPNSVGSCLTPKEQPSQDSVQSSAMPLTGESSHSTPRPGAKAPKISLDHLTQTPPFSPNGEPHSPTVTRDESISIPPKALPTPPLNQSNLYPSSSSLSSLETTDRPISHILHLPDDTSVLPAPLSPKRAPPTASTKETLDLDDFVQAAMKRHQIFLEKEVNAADDEQRLRIFSDFIIAESRIRRRRYSKAWSSGKFDVRPIRDRLFEQVEPPPRWVSNLRKSVKADPANVPLMVTTEPQVRTDAARSTLYQPCLSPIASMSNNDELSSRGRTASRWWESQTDSQSEGITRKIERSKRESKYMGLPRELREAMQWGDALDGRSSVGPNGHYPINEEYPPEKANVEIFGYYDDGLPSTPSVIPATTSPYLDGPRKLDVSRLVTLPPPYPRHYPAVNNSHPDLVSYRTVVRSVSDLQEVTARKKRYTTNMEALQKDSEQKMMENRKTFRANIHAQIEEGSISFTEAAEAEQALKDEENQLEKQGVQAEFDSFQDVVLNPLHEMLNERISQVSQGMTDLCSKLDHDAQNPDPNQAQEEGDEQPELLETLTQLKWLFEARENIHREIFDLLSERNDKFKAIVLLPYNQAQNLDKIRDTETFFASDDNNRRIAFERDSLARHEDFLRVIDQNVVRGVETQLSAFWDIAPDLVGVLQSIPEDMETFEGVEVPELELAENPSYQEFPLQYLYDLLAHAERSAYQFIESQINLLCLQHEAKTGTMIAEFKVNELVQPSSADDSGAEVMHQEPAARARSEEERSLTAELKEKVATVEEQWIEALGSQVGSTKERIKNCLLEMGGWEDMEEPEG